MNILEIFGLYQTQLKNRKFEIYIDYTKTDYLLDNNVDYQKIISYSAVNKDEVEYESDVSSFLNCVAPDLICVNSMYFKNIPAKEIRDNVGDSDNITVFYGVEYIPELRCINLVSSILVQSLDSFAEPSEFSRAAEGYIIAKELDIIYRYNHSKLGSSKGNSAVLKKNLPGVILIPKLMGDGGTICKFRLSMYFNTGCKLACNMILPNSLPYQGNTTHEECVSHIYHFGQIVEALHLGDDKGAVAVFRNKPEIAIDIIYYLLNSSLKKEIVTVISQKGIPVIFLFTGEDTTVLSELLSNGTDYGVERIDFVEYLYHKHSLGYITLSEFRNYLEVLI